MLKTVNGVMGLCDQQYTNNPIVMLTARKKGGLFVTYANEQMYYRGMKPDGFEIVATDGESVAFPINIMLSIPCRDKSTTVDFDFTANNVTVKTSSGYKATLAVIMDVDTVKRYVPESIDPTTVTLPVSAMRVGLFCTSFMPSVFASTPAPIHIHHDKKANTLRFLSHDPSRVAITEFKATENTKLDEDILVSSSVLLTVIGLMSKDTDNVFEMASTEVAYTFKSKNPSFVIKAPKNQEIAVIPFDGDPMDLKAELAERVNNGVVFGTPVLDMIDALSQVSQVPKANGLADPPVRIIISGDTVRLASSTDVGDSEIPLSTAVVSPTGFEGEVDVSPQLFSDILSRTGSERVSIVFWGDVKQSPKDMAARYQQAVLIFTELGGLYAYVPGAKLVKAIATTAKSTTAKTDAKPAKSKTIPGKLPAKKKAVA